MATTTMDASDREGGPEELAQECAAERMEELAVVNENIEAAYLHEQIPWIGALRNPRLGPMVVLDDKGYLVPLCTARDLLRGCRYFWRASQD
jgi:hypothetical protein